MVHRHGHRPGGWVDHRYSSTEIETRRPLQALEGETAGLRRQMEGERSAAAKQVTQIREDASRQMRQLTDRDEALLANERNLHDREMETVRSAHAKQIASLESQIAEERRHATELRRRTTANGRSVLIRSARRCGRMRPNSWLPNNDPYRRTTASRWMSYSNRSRNSLPTSSGRWRKTGRKVS